MRIAAVRCALCLVLVPIVAGGSGPAVQEPERLPATAAFLFTYRPKPGLEAQFDEGYRRHLEWHEGASDPLPWFGWYVTTGDRIGTFVDGTFGVPFGAFDERVDPRGDAADFARQAGPFADALTRSVYRLRNDLGTDRSLELRAPSPVIEVIHIRVRPGAEKAFERGLGRLREATMRSAGRYACYQLVVGGERPSYLVMIPRNGWAAYDRPPAAGADALTAAVLDAGQPEVAAALHEAVERMWTETWSYRADLSLLPPR